MADRPLPADLAAVVARLGADPTSEPRALVAARRPAIADRRGYLSFDVDEIGWRLDLLSPEAETVRGRTLADALA